MEDNIVGYSEDTEVLTRDGFKLIVDLHKDDLVASVGKDSNRFEYSSYSNLFIRDYEGSMINLNNRYCDTFVAPDQAILVKRDGRENKKKNEYFTVKAKDIKLGARRVKICGESTLPDYPLSDDWYRLFAWLNTDGSVTKNSKLFSYKIFQVESKSHLIEDVLKRLGLKFRMSVRTRTIESICGKELINHTNRHCTYSLCRRNIGDENYKILTDNLYEKYDVPSILFSSSQRQIRIYLQSFIDGDGTRKPNLPNWAQIYGIERLLNQVQQLIIMSGGYAKIGTYRIKDWRVYYQIDKLDTTIIPKYVFQKTYKGKIWGLNTPNGSIVTRRKGIINVQGDCSPVVEDRTRMILENNKVPITQLSLDRKVIAQYSFTGEANKITGILGSAISNCLNGRTKTAGGFIWEYTWKRESLTTADLTPPPKISPLTLTPQVTTI